MKARDGYIYCDDCGVNLSGFTGDPHRCVDVLEHEAYEEDCMTWAMAQRCRERRGVVRGQPQVLLFPEVA